MIFIAAASSKVARDVVAGLAGVPLVAGYRDPGKSPPGTEARRCDFDDAASIAEAVRGCTAAFLINGGSPRQKEQEILFAETAAANGVTHIVKLSVWQAETEAYAIARMHRTVEKRIEALGVAWTFLRPTGFMNNFLGNAAQIKAGRLVMPAGESRVSHIDAFDVARSAAAVLRNPGAHAGRVYGLTGPAALSYHECMMVIGRETGRQVTFVDMPAEQWQQQMAAMGMPAARAAALADLLSYYKTGRSTAVTDTVEKLTGTAPKDFARFVHEHRDAFM